MQRTLSLVPLIGGELSEREHRQDKAAIVNNCHRDEVTVTTAVGGAGTSASCSRRQTSKFRSLFKLPARFRWALLHTWSWKRRLAAPTSCSSTSASGASRTSLCACAAVSRT